MRRLGPGDGFGRADRPVGADRSAGPVEKTCRVASAGANPARKLSAIIAGMAAGADSIDDLDLIRCGGMRRLFGGVYASATLGQLLREFTHGHTLQVASVLRAHLVNLGQPKRFPQLPRAPEQVLVDHRVIDRDELACPDAGSSGTGRGA